MANITFMIGNGFDLACKLKCKYADTYDGYINKESRNDVIKHFKEIIQKDIDTWGNFELALGKYASEFSSENEIKDCLTDYVAYLSDYLENEQKKFWESNKDSLSSNSRVLLEFGRSLKEFHHGLVPNDANAIDYYLRNKVSYNFISFNYTDIFDKFAETAFKQGIIQNEGPIPSPIHIHGNLGDAIIVGVDNADQLEKIKYEITDEGLRSLLKPEYVDSYDRQRKRKVKDIIFDSQVICCFGLSLGASDLFWRNELASWVSLEYGGHLVLFNYENMNKSYHPSLKMQMKDEEDKLKNNLIKLFYGDSPKDEILQRAQRRIHIPLGNKIFNFENLLYDDESNSSNRSQN